MRPSARPAVGAALLGAAGAMLLAGCGAQVPGHPTAAAAGVTRHIESGLPALLPDSTQFPAKYPAVVLPPEAAAQATGDLSGAGRGANVSPPQCAPPPQQFGPDQTAVAVGTDNEARTTLTVELQRTRQPLSALRAQLKQCATVHVSKAGAQTTVTTELERPPRIDADDTLALRRTVTPAVGGPGLTASMQTRTAQVGDVRITVTYMTFGGGAPGAAALDELFTTAVRKVQQG